jgi:hypothetical protein
VKSVLAIVTISIPCEFNKFFIMAAFYAPSYLISGKWEDQFCNGRKEKKSIFLEMSSNHLLCLKNCSFHP